MDMVIEKLINLISAKEQAVVFSENVLRITEFSGSLYTISLTLLYYNIHSRI